MQAQTQTINECSTKNTEIDNVDEDDFKDVVDDVGAALQDGSYFEDARKWYLRKYGQIGTRDVYTLLCAIISFVAAIFIAHAVLLEYATVHMPFPIYGESGELPYIYNLTEENENINVSIARYLVKYYVELRENYDSSLLTSSNLQTLMTNVSHMSSMRTFSEFYNYISPQHNPNSPLLRCRFTSRKINVQMITFESIGETPGYAKVFFTAEESDVSGKILSTDWVVTLRLDMSRAYEVYLKGGKMQFFVLQYSKKKLSEELYG